MPDKKDLHVDPSERPSLRAVLRAHGQVIAQRLAQHRKVTAAAVALALVVVMVCAAALLDKARHAVRTIETESIQRSPSLAAALEAFDAGYFSEARRLAKKLSPQTLPPAERGGADFIFGAVAMHEGEIAWGRERKSYYASAASHLQLAIRRGVPGDRNAQAAFLLGKSLAKSGRFKESRGPLENALVAGSPESTEIHRILANVYARGEQPNPDKALAHLTAYLGNPRLTERQRHSGWLRQAKILFQKGEPKQCLAVLAQIPPSDSTFPQSAVLTGRILMREAAQLKQDWQSQAQQSGREAFEKKYDQAIDILRRGQDDPLAVNAVRQSMYLIGRCLLEKDDRRAALAQFTRTRRVYLETHEGIAAAIEEADLLRAGRRDEALALYLSALETLAVCDPALNQWLPREELRDRVIAAYNHYLSLGQFAQATAIAEQIGPLTSAARACELSAEALRAEAQQNLTASQTQPRTQGRETARAGRRLMRQAGRKFNEVAKLEFTSRQYPDDMWRVAECLLSGQDFSGALDALEEYQKYELRRRPQALVLRAEALLALGRVDDAITSLRECIDLYPNDAALFRARLLASQAYLEKHKVAPAEALLRENLSGEFLTPDSKEWKDSLFALGKLMQADGRYEEAISRLQEAVERYPGTHQAIEARYLVAESYRLAAKVPQEKLKTATIEATRLAHFKEVQHDLEAAIHFYEEVERTINRTDEKLEPTTHELAMLRNSYFAVGAALFDLARYEEAIRAYSKAISRYQHDPEALDAFVQIASCYRRLNKRVEARGTFQQAKVVLSRIAPTADFTKTTNFTRDDWTRVLEWLTKL